jgi:chromosome segregation ATPase
MIDYQPAEPVEETTLPIMAGRRRTRRWFTWTSASMLTISALLVATGMLAWSFSNDESAITHANASIADLRATNEGLSGDLAGTKSQLDSVQRQNDVLRAQVGTLSTQLNQAKSQADQANANVQRMATQVAQSNANAQQMANQANQANARADQSNASAQRVAQHPFVCGVMGLCS